MTIPNAELAYEVLDYIEAHPEQHSQRDFLSFDQSVSAPELMPCGTTACFAGWTVLLSGHGLLRVPDVNWPIVELDGRQEDCDDAAAQLLGLGDRGTRGDAEHLFYLAMSLDSVKQQVARIFGPRPEPTA